MIRVTNLPSAANTAATSNEKGKGKEMVSVTHCDSLWFGADIITMRGGNYQLIPQGAIAVTGDKIVWIGPHAELPPIHAARQVVYEGGLITPGLIDCHTHLVFGDDRSNEFEQRLNGVSYAEIAANGGGIISTVRATRQASEQQLLEQALFRLKPLLAEGVTTIEIKSGYGLNLESEIKMLRVARRLGELLPIDVKTTCLAAHALPPEFIGQPDDYIDVVCNSIIPQVAVENLADAVDAFANI